MRALGIGIGIAFARIVLGGAAPAGPTGDGILLEDGSSFLLAENSDYIILE